MNVIENGECTCLTYKILCDLTNKSVENSVFLVWRNCTKPIAMKLGIMRRIIYVCATLTRVILLTLEILTAKDILIAQSLLQLIFLNYDYASQ